MSDDLLVLENVDVGFATDEGQVSAVSDVSLSVAEGEIFGLVGESGCGKTTLAMATMGLLPRTATVSGSVRFQGRELVGLGDEELRRLRGDRISMVFQDPMTSLNPVLTIGQQLEEPLMLHVGMNRQQARDRSAELLALVGIPKAKERLGDYPHQFSGGMRQRVMIAMALSCSPQVLIADEPTTALDVTIQAQIIELVKRLRDDLGMAVIWITHDLGVIAGLADRVLVMYGGFIIEEAPVKELYANPRHPYTIGLIGSLPRVDEKQHTRLESIDGLPPILYEMPASCPFAPRCKWAIEHCWKENPALEPVGVDKEHRIACWVDVKTGRERR